MDMATGEGRSNQWSHSLLFIAIKVLQRLEFFDKCLILILQDRHSILQAFHVVLFLPTTLTGSLAILSQTHLALPRRFLSENLCHSV